MANKGNWEIEHNNLVELDVRELGNWEIDLILETFLFGEMGD